MRFPYLTAVLIAISVPTPVLVAQAPEASITNRSPAQATVSAPTGTAGVVPTSLIATVTTADKRITGSFGFDLYRKQGTETHLWLRGSGPLDENDSKAPVVLADLKGLRNATLLAAGVNFLRWRWEANDTATTALCRRVFSNPATIPDSLRARLKKELDSLEKARNLTVADPIARARDSVTKLTRLSETRCIRSIVPNQKEWDTLWDYGKIWFGGVSGEFGRRDYKYADTLAAAFKKNVERPWTLSANVGVYLPESQTALALIFRAEHGFEEGPPRSYCIPVGTTPATQCRSVPLGPPEQEDPVLLTFEARRFISTHVGLSPSVTYDFSGGRGVGVELPILLRQATDKGFTSAMILGWRSRPLGPDTDDRVYVALTFGVTYGIVLGQ